MTLRLLWVMLLLCRVAPAARAGGGPENVLLLVNANSDSSKTIANHYIALRKIPPSNVLYVDWKGNLESCSGRNFRDLILRPAIKAIEDRRLANQIDYIVYSSDFPWRVELRPLFPDEEFPAEFQPFASLPGATYLARYLLGDEPNPALIMPSVNWYVPNSARSLSKCEELGNAPSRALRFRYAWNREGQRLAEGDEGQHFFLSAMLGVTQGRGNSVDEVISYLKRAAAADGTRPRGTIYFMRNGNIRSQVRHDCYEAAATAIRRLGIQARVLTGKIPTGAKDVMGIMAGAESFDVAAAQNVILPGAICEHLTSVGGNLSANSYQTPLSEFLRAGAAGASGAVIEPRALQAKFPLPTLQLHYARGCSLAEAFYQSVAGPYQLLIVGDPLCQPWAVRPTVQSAGITAGQEVSGEMSIMPAGAGATGRRIGAYDLFLDGRLVARAAPGNSLNLDTTKIEDGAHELRVVAVNVDSIETQGRLIVPFTVKNAAPVLEFAINPPGDVPRTATLRVTAKQEGASGLSIRQNSRELGRIDSESGTLEIAAALLGGGPTTLHAVSLGARPAVSPAVSLHVR